MVSERKTLTLLIVRGSGRATTRLELPAWSRAFWMSFWFCLLAAPVSLGFQIQRMQGPRPRVLLMAQRDEEAARFSMFELILPRNRAPSAADLLRRAAILHAMKLGLGLRRAASTMYAGLVLPEWKQDVERGPSWDGTLLWPVREGLYVRGYGSGEAGYHLAVDIMGTRGSAVLSAAPGVVGYVGNELEGYGNLVIVLHPGGAVTFYAHNESNKVVAGQRVARGERVAILGNTGRSRGPHVHFEFLQGGRNCDPLSLFRPSVRHQPGHLGEIKLATWVPNTERPTAVRCDWRRHYPRHADDEEGLPVSSGSPSAEHGGLVDSPTAHSVQAMRGTQHELGVDVHEEQVLASP